MSLTTFLSEKPEGEHRFKSTLNLTVNFMPWTKKKLFSECLPTHWWISTEITKLE